MWRFQSLSTETAMLTACMGVWYKWRTRQETSPTADQEEQTMGREDMLKSVPIFAELSKRDLGNVAKIMVPRTAAAGEVIIKENDQAAGFFIISSGKVEVM